MPPFLGLHIPNFTYPGTDSSTLFPRVLAIAGTAELSGFNALSVMDHLHQIAPQGKPDEPMLEAYVTLAAIAARTERLRLLTLVTGVTYHNPARLAKQVTTLDVISGGRAILGIGAAWFEEEHRAYGFEFPPIGRRLDRLEEAVQIARSMFDNKVTEYEGRYYHVQGAINVPRPVQDHLPILIGGGGERRTLRLVARHADLCNILGSRDDIARKFEVLRAHCEAEGRDIGQIVKTAHAGIVVVDEHEAAVRRRLESFAAAPPPMFQGLSADELGQRLVSGTPEQVTEKLRALLATGADGITLSVWGASDLEPVAMAGAAATAALGIRT